MPKTWTRFAAATTLLLGLGGLEARADFSYALEFNVDGVLPSTDPNIGLVNNTGLPEASIFSVAAGVLHQDSMGIFGAPSYWYPKDLGFGGQLNAALNFSMESRIRINAIEGSIAGGAGMQAANGLYRYAINFSTTGVELLTSTSPIAVAVDFSQAHTYRLDATGGTNTVRLSIDGILRASGIAPSVPSWNFFSFGDGFSVVGAGANADYDYVRVINANSVPEPSTLALLALGLPALAIARRARRGRPAA